MTLRIQLCGIGTVISDGVDVRECFHSELAVEPATERIEDLVLLLCPVPYVPLVHVSNGGIRGLQSIAPWRTWMIWYMWAFGSYGFRKDLVGSLLASKLVSQGVNTCLLVDVPGWEVGLQPAFRILILVVVRQPKRLLHLIILVVTSIDN